MKRINTRALARSMAWVDGWLQRRCDTGDIPGFVVAVSHRGRPALDAAYGWADLERRSRMRPGHVFRVASHSKTFTATAILQLAERGLLRLDDPADGHLPWLADHHDRRMKQITVRQLLSHGAGVIRDGLDADYWQLTRPFPDLDRFRRDVLDADLVLEPNVKLKYSNYGYTLLGLIVEAASGQAYNDYVAEHVVAAIGLADTGPEHPGHRTGDLVTGYTRADVDRTRLPVPFVDTRVMSAATGFYSTAADLCTYFTAQLPGSRRVLTDASKREMQRVQWHAHKPGPAESRQDYGLGFDIEAIGERRVIGHGGGFPGQITRSTADPADGLVVVALTNCVDGPAGDIVKGVWGAIDWFQAHDAAAVRGPDLHAIEGRYCNLWNVTDVVAAGDGVVAVSPDSWEPFAAVDTLDVVDATTLRVTDTSSFGSEGELVRFATDGGTVTSVDWTGGTLWPEATWLRRQRRLVAKAVKSRA